MHKSLRAMGLILAALMLMSSTPVYAGAVKENGADRGAMMDLDFRNGPSVSGRSTKVIDFSTMAAEGATADAYETTTGYTDPTADRTILFPDASGTILLSTAATGEANSITGAANGFIYEGATADAYETTTAITDPTADRTVTTPDQTGTVQLSGAATALTAGTSVTLTVAPGNRLYTDTITTDNQDQTITFSGAGAAGDEVTIIFVTDGAGSGDEVITFHSTLVRSTGTLTLANAAASRYVVRFMSDGTKWNEISRTAVQAA